MLDTFPVRVTDWFGLWEEWDWMRVGVGNYHTNQFVIRREKGIFIAVVIIVNEVKMPIVGPTGVSPTFEDGGTCLILSLDVCVCACPPVMRGDTVKHALTSTSSPPNDIPSIPWSPVVLPLWTPWGAC